MTRENVEFLQEKGKWHPDSELKAFSKMSLKQIEKRENNVRANGFVWLDMLYDDGKIDFENPPNIWILTFQRWIYKRFGLKVLVDYLKNVDLKDKPSLILGRLQAIGGITCEEIEAVLQPKKKFNKSSVCRIANKVSRSVSRKEAFQIAWRIVKNGGYEVKVAGVSFNKRQEALKRLTAYNPNHIHTVLVSETDNKYDKNAISVQVMVDGQKGIYRLGYVPKTETAIVKAFIGTVPELKVIDGDIRGARIAINV